MTVAAHEQDFTIVEHDLIAEHGERKSAEFDRNKAILVKNHPGCWMATDVCDGSDPIEAHHIVEFSEWEKTDPERLKALLMAFDPYGYSAAMKDIPIHAVDDIRNLVLGCARCHRGVGMGIHHLSAPTWFARKTRRAGESTTLEEKQLRERMKGQKSG